MKLSRINWLLWLGFLLCFLAFVSYPFLFGQFAATRDFPWVNLLLFAISAVLLFLGVKRAFSSDRPRRSKIAGVIVTGLSVLIIAGFVFTSFVMSRWLPPSSGAPQVGQKAPDFTLTDTDGKAVSLSSLVSAPLNGKAPKGVLLVFYRGYW
jgi:membrane protease YdiL (CAAX protease family)